MAVFLDDYRRLEKVAGFAARVERGEEQLAHAAKKSRSFLERVWEAVKSFFSAITSALTPRSLKGSMRSFKRNYVKNCLKVVFYEKAIAKNTTEPGGSFLDNGFVMKQVREVLSDDRGSSFRDRLSLTKKPREKVTKTNRDLVYDSWKSLLAKRNVTLNECSVHLGEEVEMSCCMLSGKQRTDKWIIYFPSCYNYWEYSLKELSDLQRETGANIFSFNYRNLGKSVSHVQSEDTLQETIDDCVSLLLHLHTYQRDKSTPVIRSTQATLYGKLAGAGIALSVGKRLKEKNHEYTYILEQGFTSVEALYKEKGGFLRPLDMRAIRSYGWDMNIEQLVKEVPGKKVLLTQSRNPLIPAAFQLKTEHTEGQSKEYAGPLLMPSKQRQGYEYLSQD